MKRCPKCQYPNPDNRTDCYKCGVSLDPNAVPAAVTAEPPQVVTPPSGGYAGQPQAPGSYQAPPPSPSGYPGNNSSYSTPVLMPVSNKAPVNRGLLLGIGVLIVIVLFGGIQFYMAGKFNKAVNSAN